MLDIIKGVIIFLFKNLYHLHVDSFKIFFCASSILKCFLGCSVALCRNCLLPLETGIMGGSWEGKLEDFMIHLGIREKGKRKHSTFFSATELRMRVWGRVLIPEKKEN